MRELIDIANELALEHANNKGLYERRDQMHDDHEKAEHALMDQIAESQNAIKHLQDEIRLFGIQMEGKHIAELQAAEDSNLNDMPPDE